VRSNTIAGSLLVSTLAIALCLLMGRSTSAADARPAPTVLLHREDGAAVRLSDYAGNVVLVDFWASWCTPCKASFPVLDALYQREKDRGLQVFAVNVDEQRKAADAFLAARPHLMPIVFDPKGEVAQAFEVRGMPSSVLIDRSGHIRFTHMGYSAKIVDSYQQEISLLLSERR